MNDEPAPLSPQPYLSTVRPPNLLRDALHGPPAMQERHRLARVALLRLLLARPEVEQHYRLWCREGTIGSISALAIGEYERIARNAGLPGRAALWDAQLDAEHRSRVNAASHAWLDAMKALIVRGEDSASDTATDDLAAGLAERLQVPYPWLTLEMQWLFLVALTGYLADAPVDFDLFPYERDILNAAVHLRLQAGESEAAFIERAKAERLRALSVMSESTATRMPKDADYIRRSVAWLVRRRLDGVSIRRLAREHVAAQDLARTAAGVIPLRGDGRVHVRESIARAQRWLRAVAHPTVPGALPIRKRRRPPSSAPGRAPARPARGKRRGKRRR